MWTYRSIRFLAALLRGDFGGTFLVGHPGVITMICGATGIAVRRFVLGYGSADFSWLSGLPSLGPWDVEALRRLAPFLPAAKLPMAVLNAACVVGIYSLAKRLFDARAAFLAVLFLALDPFHLALSRVLHIDAPAANFMILSVLSLLLYLRHCSRPYLLLSGALAGLAFLSKSYSLFLVPFTGLLLAAACWVKQRHLREAALPFALWGVGAALTFFALWPAMWVDPISTVRGVLDTAFGYAATPYATSKFFLGKVVDDPGPLFYLIAVAFRTTPLVWLGLLAIIPYRCADLRIHDTHPGPSPRQTMASRQFGIIALLVYACFFVAFVGLGAKKFDRYTLPAILALDIVAAVGLAQLTERSTRRVLVVSLSVALIIQGAFVLSYHPYYLAYYNPLLSGARLAPKVLPMGWGEGMDLAADYLNRKENAGELSVATWGIPGFAPLFEGRVESLTERGLATTDYALLYISDVQQHYADINAFRGQQPEHVVRVRGIDYVWIYPNTEHAELASYLQSWVGPDDVVLLDTLSPVIRHYQMPCHIIDSQSEAEVVVRLTDIAADHQRLWYVAYPEGDPKGWIDYQLSAHALLVERRTFPHVTASCYFLPPHPTFGVTSIQADPNVNFGSRLRLTGYGFAEDVIEYRKKLGVTLRWQAQQGIEENYALSLRVVDDEGHPWAQEDRWLLNSSGLPSSAWEAGERSEERHLLTIPPGIPPGCYEVKAIVYQTDTLEKVVILDAMGMPRGMEYILGTISVASATAPRTLGELGIPHALSCNFNGQVELLGYGLSADQVRSGDTLGLILFWRALRSMEQDYTLLLELRDGAGYIWTEARFLLANEWYPTSHWQPGEILRVPSDLLIDGAVPPGRYWLFVNLLDGDGKSLVEDGFCIAELRIEGREHLFTEPKIGFPLRVRIAESVALIGYDLDRTSVEPGGTMRLTLYWRALARMETSYTVFTHLLDAEGHIRGQRDSAPCGGACPTTSWLEGEVVTDEYDIVVDPDAPAGEYQIEVGMYDPKTMRRLPAFDDAGRRLSDDRILVGSKIIVESRRK